MPIRTLPPPNLVPLLRIYGLLPSESGTFRGVGVCSDTYQSMSTGSVFQHSGNCELQNIVAKPLESLKGTLVSRMPHLLALSCSWSGFLRTAMMMTTGDSLIDPEIRRHINANKYQIYQNYENAHRYRYMNPFIRQYRCRS
jgi:hypothetical protein